MDVSASVLMLKPMLRARVCCRKSTPLSLWSPEHLNSQYYRVKRHRAPQNQIRHSSLSLTSELGLRKDLPPDSFNANTKGEGNPSPSSQSPKSQDEVSDREWEIRTGRAIDVLTQTLPDFFNVGLLTTIDKSTGEPQPTSSIHLPVVNANPLDYRTRNESLESLYSPKVRLSYTPPVELPAPFPKTLHVEGLPLYIASSAFVRHTLNTLYSDLQVTLHKVVVNTPKSSVQHPTLNKEDLISSNQNKNREKSLIIGLRVTGNLRVSRAIGEWEVACTYGFSPTTGLIHVHTINSIEPAPHQTVYDMLRASLGSVFGFGVPGAPERIERPGGAAFDGRRPEFQVQRVSVPKEAKVDTK